MKVLRMMVAVAVLVMATMASAEQFSNRTVKIPFTFTAGDHTLPAGEYQIQVDGKTFILTNASGQTTLALSHGVQSHVPAEKSKLEFVNNGGSYYLLHVWLAGRTSGLELSLGRDNQKIAEKKSGKTTVGIGL